MSACARGILVTICGSFWAFYADVERIIALQYKQVLQSEFESVHKDCVAFYFALQCVLGHFTSLLKVGWFLNVAHCTCHISEWWHCELWVVTYILCFKLIVSWVLDCFRQKRDIWRRHLEVLTIIFFIYWCLIGWPINRSITRTTTMTIPITINCTYLNLKDLDYKVEMALYLMNYSTCSVEDIQSGLLLQVL